MTQDERWNIRYQEVLTFIETNKRNPSKYFPEERNMVNFLKHTRKQMNQGLLKEDRIEAFQKLLEMMEKYKRKNQYERSPTGGAACKAARPACGSWKTHPIDKAVVLEEEL